MEYIISAVWSSIELVALVFFNKAFLIEKTEKQRWGLFIVLNILVCVLRQLMSPSRVLNQLVSILFLWWFTCYTYSGKPLKKLMIVVIGYTVIVAIDNAVLFVAAWTLGISVQTLMWRKLAYVVLVTSIKLLELLFSWLLQRIRPVKKAQPIPWKWTLMTVMFPLVSIFMMAVLFDNSRYNHDLSKNVVVFSCLLFAANIAVIRIVFTMEKEVKTQQENALLNQQMQLQTASLLSLQDAYHSQRQASHDFQRHIQTLSSLLEAEQITQAKRYLCEIGETQTTRVLSVNSRNAVIDAILNQKYQAARAKGIDMNIRVNDLSAVCLPTSELVVLLSNLLDNAIEACQKLQGEKYIDCKIVLEEQLYFSIRNTSQPVEIVEDQIITSKPFALEHGYGLPNVQRILRKLNGEYSMAYNNGWFQFAAEVPNMPHSCA